VCLFAQIRSRSRPGRADDLALCHRPGAVRLSAHVEQVWIDHDIVGDEFACRIQRGFGIRLGGKHVAVGERFYPAAGAPIDDVAVDEPVRGEHLWGRHGR
jgi:hypothetical protein